VSPFLPACCPSQKAVSRKGQDDDAWCPHRGPAGRRVLGAGGWRRSQAGAAGRHRCGQGDLVCRRVQLARRGRGGWRAAGRRPGWAGRTRAHAWGRERQGNAAMVVVGIEAAGHHHQTLTAHLLDRDELVVRVLNPAQVAAVRKQQGNRRRKTDWLDAAAVCELLARGEGALVHLDGSAASALRPLWSGRNDLVDIRSRLRQQAGALVDCLWPGCSAKDTAAGITPVLCDLFATKAGRVLL